MIQEYNGSDEAFIQLGKIVLGEEPLPQLLERVLRLGQEVLRPPTEASITLVAGDAPTTVAFTGPLALALDERQYADERGPCLDAAAAGSRILIGDMSSETRWRRFSEAAVDLGVGSSLSLPLPVQGNVTGALNFYATTAAGFDEETVDLAETFAAHAAVAVANAHLYETTAALADQMRQAMETRAVIEQAKGVIMSQRRCCADEAFSILVRASQTSHVKVRDVAQRLIGQLADKPATPGG